MPRFLRLELPAERGWIELSAGTIAIANLNTGRDDNTSTIYPAASDRFGEEPLPQ